MATSTSILTPFCTETPGRVKHRRMQNCLGTVDVFDETLDSAGKGEVLFLDVALIDQFDLDAIVEERQFAQTFGK